jgi:hypothetical protein
MIRRRSLGSLLAAGAAAALAVPTSPAQAAGDVKTLDDIKIEGEVRLPRVLFITSRETVRPLDFLGLCLPPAEGEARPVGPVPVVGAPAEAAPGTAASPAESAPASDSQIPAPTDTSREESR